LNRSRRASAQENERDYWDTIDRDVRSRELSKLAAIHNPGRDLSGFQKRLAAQRLDSEVDRRALSRMKQERERDKERGR